MSGESWRKKVSWSYRGEPLQDEDETDPLISASSRTLNDMNPNDDEDDVVSTSPSQPGQDEAANPFNDEIQVVEPPKPSQIEIDIQDAQIAAHNNIQRLLHRGENISELQEKAQELQSTGNIFRKTTKKAYNEAWWDELSKKSTIYSLYTIMGLIMIMLVLGIFQMVMNTIRDLYNNPAAPPSTGPPPPPSGVPAPGPNPSPGGPGTGTGGGVQVTCNCYCPYSDGKKPLVYGGPIISDAEADEIEEASTTNYENIYPPILVQ